MVHHVAPYPRLCTVLPFCKGNLMMSCLGQTDGSTLNSAGRKIYSLLS